MFPPDPTPTPPPDLDIPDENWNQWTPNEPPDPANTTDLVSAYQTWYANWGREMCVMFAVLVGPKFTDPTMAPAIPPELKELFDKAAKLKADGKLNALQKGLLVQDDCTIKVLQAIFNQFKLGKPAGYKFTKADFDCMIRGCVQAAAFLKLGQPR